MKTLHTTSVRFGLAILAGLLVFGLVGCQSSKETIAPDAGKAPAAGTAGQAVPEPPGKM